MVIGYTALMLAAQRGHEQIVTLLLGHGATLNTTNELGHNALFLATLNNHAGVVRTLLLAGSDKEARDMLGRKAIDYAPSEDVRDLLENFNTH